MTIPSKTKSHSEQILSGIYARRPRENNKWVCKDCLKPRSNINTFECNNCGCSDFYGLDYQNSSLEILPSLKCIK